MNSDYCLLQNIFFQSKKNSAYKYARKNKLKNFSIPDYIIPQNQKKYKKKFKRQNYKQSIFLEACYKNNLFFISLMENNQKQFIQSEKLFDYLKEQKLNRLVYLSKFRDDLKQIGFELNYKPQITLSFLSIASIISRNTKNIKSGYFDKHLLTQNNKNAFFQILKDLMQLKLESYKFLYSDFDLLYKLNKDNKLYIHSFGLKKEILKEIINKYNVDGVISYYKDEESFYTTNITKYFIDENTTPSAVYFSQKI